MPLHYFFNSISLLFILGRQRGNFQTVRPVFTENHLCLLWIYLFLCMFGKQKQFSVLPQAVLLFQFLTRDVTDCEKQRGYDEINCSSIILPLVNKCHSVCRRLEQAAQQSWNSEKKKKKIWLSVAISAWSADWLADSNAVKLLAWNAACVTTTSKQAQRALAQVWHSVRSSKWKHTRLVSGTVNVSECCAVPKTWLSVFSKFLSPSYTSAVSFSCLLTDTEVPVVLSAKQKKNVEWVHTPGGKYEHKNGSWKQTRRAITLTHKVFTIWPICWFLNGHQAAVCCKVLKEKNHLFSCTRHHDNWCNKSDSFNKTKRILPVAIWICRRIHVWKTCCRKVNVRIAKFGGVMAQIFVASCWMAGSWKETWRVWPSEVENFVIITIQKPCRNIQTTEHLLFIGNSRHPVAFLHFSSRLFYGSVSCFHSESGFERLVSLFLHLSCTAKGSLGGKKNSL